MLAVCLQFLKVVIDSALAQDLFGPGLPPKSGFDVFRAQDFETQCRVTRVPVTMPVGARGKRLLAFKVDHRLPMSVACPTEVSVWKVVLLMVIVILRA